MATRWERSPERDLLPSSWLKAAIRNVCGIGYDRQDDFLLVFLPLSSFHPGFAHSGRGTFLCFAKEKYPKERRTRRLAPRHTGGVPRGSLRSSEKPARAQLADLAYARFGLEQGARLIRFFHAVLGCTNGTENNSPGSRGRSRASQGFWDRVSPLVRAGRGCIRPASWANAQRPEKHREP